MKGTILYANDGKQTEIVFFKAGEAKRISMKRFAKVKRIKIQR